MTLSVLNLSSKKILLYKLFLKIKFIEIYKRDYYFPFFSELFRRKGAVSLANRIDLITKKIPSQLINVEKVLIQLVSDLSTNSNFVIPSNIILKDDNNLSFYLNEEAIEGRLYCTLAFSESFEIFLSSLKLNIDHFYPSLLKEFQMILLNDEFYFCDALQFFNSLVAIEIQNKDMIEREFFKM